MPRRFRHATRLRLSTSLMLFPLLVSATATTVLTGATPASAAPSTLTKSVQDVTNPGADPVHHDDVLNWVVSYRNGGSGPASATITDLIDGAPTRQTYVPGSLRVPPQWTPLWSTDGTTFQGTDPGTATVAVRGTNAAARPGGTNVAALQLAPISAASTATGGDGYTPILYRTANGQVESWNMYHHLVPTAAKLVCVDLSTAALCGGGPWPKPINTTPGPLGSGNTGDIATPNTPQYVFDPDRQGVLYYAGITDTALGVACLDLEARANCGFFPLQNRGGSPSSANGLAGMVTAAGNLYGVSTTGQVLCMVMASRTPCAGQPYAPIVPGNNNAPNAGQLNYVGAMTVTAGKIFASSSPAGAAPALGCFDPATGTACAGWGTPRPVGVAGSRAWSAYTAFDTAGNPNGVCANATGSTVVATCYTLTGAPRTAPVFAPTGDNWFNPETVTAPNGNLQSYFPHWGTGATTCYDWTNAALCAGFPNPATHPTVNGGVTRDYGYAYDPVSECLLGLGDAGVLFSMDPTTGATPCLHSGAQVDLTPGGFYCDGGTGHVQGYDSVRLENINVANIDLAASTVTVTDPDGTVVATPALAADGSVDLSGISYAAHPSLTVSVKLVLHNTSDFTGGNQPTMVASFRGDAPQICFQTTVSADCTVTGITNTATGTDVTGALASNTVNQPIAPGAACQPRVSVNKEICLSRSAEDCGPQGNGPWAKQSRPGLLGLLGTAYWRITVTNDGPVTATGVRLNDPAEESCEQAAGTFTLPANTSAQFFCSTYLLLFPFRNTVTASFIPENSPAGTRPSTTEPSSAIACNLLCIL